MVDFAKIRAERAAAAAKAKAEAPDTPIIREPQKNWLVRINALLEEHRGVLTEWETNFLHDTKYFITGTDAWKYNQLDDLDFILTLRVKNKITEIEAQCK